MKKINTTPYKVTVNTPEGIKEVDYSVKNSIAEMLLSPDLKMGAVELLKNSILSEKILSSLSFNVLLEEEEYIKVKTALDTVRGLNKNDVELVKRIYDAEDVEVKEIGD